MENQAFRCQSTTKNPPLHNKRSFPIHLKCSLRTVSFRNRRRSALLMQLRLGEELVRATLLMRLPVSVQPRRAFPIPFWFVSALWL